MEINRLPFSQESLRKPFAHWLSGLGNLREEIGSAIEHGKIMTRLSALIALAGLFYWCPRCGQWMGEGSEGRGEGAPSTDIPPPPDRLIKALSAPIRYNPLDAGELPKRDSNKLTRKSGFLENEHGQRGDSPAKIRYTPPSIAHGRKVEAYYDGDPEPDSRPHAHSAEFLRGDGDRLPLYDRKQDGTIIYDNGVEVRLDQDNIYVWTPKQNLE